ncbi:kinase-like domain-containing protein [Sporodiniella umbellata]|nr:kinase-like domain-containing protein [Sporodiniella umbellata]
MGILKALDAVVHGGVYQPESYRKKKLYTFCEVLGNGAFAHVKRAVRIEDGQEVAIKIIPKRHIKEHHQMVKDEIEVLQGIKHPNVIELYDNFESSATGGELFDRLFERGKFSEKDAVNIVRSILKGLSYLHSHHIVHRDMKPENLLFKTTEGDDLAICDFGIAISSLGNDSLLKKVYGSPGYIAPEVLNHQNFGTPVDLWAVGVITYTLLCGYMPFQAQDTTELLNDIKHARYDFHERYWRNISSKAKDFIQRILTLDENARLTAEGALEHIWMTSEDIQDIDILNTVRENFNPRRKLKSAVNAVKVMNRLKKDSIEHTR